MANARRHLGIGLVVAVLGAALFWIASAYVIDHEHGKILATVVGAFAFPVAPIAWHLFAERRRRARVAAAKTPPKSTLTGIDRYWMRFVVVALAVLGPMFAVSKFTVLGAVWRHPLWFIPDSPPDISAIGTGAQRDFKDAEKLLKRVPSDAELVIVAHQDADAGKAGGSAVFAWGARQAMLAADSSLRDADKSVSDQVDALNDARGKMPWLPFDKLSVISSSDPVVVASDGWKTKVDPPATGPSEELLGELRRAPQNAVFVAAITPRTKLTAKDLDPSTIRHGVLWLTSGDDKLVFAGRIEAVDAATATKLTGEIDDVLHGKTTDIPESCRAPVAKIIDHFTIQHDGAIVTARLEIPSQSIMELMFCAMK
jgi:hypothetical protein